MDKEEVKKAIHSEENEAGEAGEEELELEWAQTKVKRQQREGEKARKREEQLDRGTTSVSTELDSTVTKNDDDEADKNDSATEAYLPLLQKLMDELADRPAAATSGRGRGVEQPIVVKLGSKRTLFGNFARICKQLNRTAEHVQSFIATELDTQCSEQPEGRLALKGIWCAKQVESVLSKYIREYVQCASCKALSTLLQRDPSTRLSSLHCTACHGVSSIVQGFHATNRADRAAARQ